LNPDQVQRSLAEQGVKYCMASFVDMHGLSKAKFVPLAHFGHMLEGSELFTGAAVEGVPQDVSEEEVAAHPDPASCTVLPWQKDVAWFASDLWCRGTPFEACSRNILKRQIERALGLGFMFKLGIEAEFYVLRDVGNRVEPVAERDRLRQPCYDVHGVLDNLHWLSDLVEAMQALGWGVYSFDHEDGNGQFEIDFNYADARTTADRFVFFRMMASQIARRHGHFASFMPKPFADKTGSGAHFNMSLADAKTDRNLFEEKNDPRGCGISGLGYQFVAGVLRHLSAITAVVAPTVNSYKRLVKQGAMSQFTWAPVFACYGNNNRTNAVRIPRAGGRVELRPADSACNPYLGAALVLAAGLEGIEQGLDSGEPHRENMYLKTEEELAGRGVTVLPRTLGEALEGFRSDPLSRAVFGDAMYASWLASKDNEWRSFQNHVSDWERERYLKFF
jgi:glutamine synthetase